MNKLYRYILVSLTSAFYISIAHAQVLDNMSTFKNINSDRYFRFHYDNDYFTKMDHYYTQGVTLEYASPGLSHFFLNKILIRPSNTEKKYGLSANLYGYTPINKTSPDIVYGDRPFTSALSLKSFVITSDSIRKIRISSSINLGVFGPWGFGEEIQVGIHKALKNVIPRGWGNQLHNDAIVNYQVIYEKQLLNNGHNFLLNGAGEARVGTFEDKLSAGINLMFGHFNDPYQFFNKRSKRWQYYFYGQARGHAIGYDATLQGGLFNRNSPYTISAGDVTRFVFQADAGLIVSFKKLYFSYAQSYITKEFATGDYHRWGGVTFGIGL